MCRRPQIASLHYGVVFSLVPGWEVLAYKPPLHESKDPFFILRRVLRAFFVKVQPGVRNL